MADLPRGRARNASDRASILRRLGAVWDGCPSLRLGQLIVNAAGGDPFYIEDDALAVAAEQFSRAPGPRTEWGLRWADGTLENVSDRYEDEAEAETVARALAEPHRQPPGNPLTLVRREPGGEWEEVRDE